MGGIVGGLVYRVTRWPFIRQLLLYGLFGAVAAASDFCVFVLLRHIGWSLLVANLVSVNLGIALSFLCNAFLNFRRTDRLGRRAGLFAVVGWLGLGLSTLILHLGVVVWQFPEIWVKAFSVGAVALFQFTLNKLVTFRVVWSLPADDAVAAGQVEKEGARGLEVEGARGLEAAGPSPQPHEKLPEER